MAPLASGEPSVRDSQRQLAEDFTRAVIAAAEITIAEQPEDLADGAPKPQPEARIVPRA